MGGGNGSLVIQSNNNSVVIISSNSTFITNQGTIDKISINSDFNNDTKGHYYFINNDKIINSIIVEKDIVFTTSQGIIHNQGYIETITNNGTIDSLGDYILFSNIGNVKHIINNGTINTNSNLYVSGLQGVKLSEFKNSGIINYYGVSGSFKSLIMMLEGELDIFHNTKTGNIKSNQTILENWGKVKIDTFNNEGLIEVDLTKEDNDYAIEIYHLEDKDYNEYGINNFHNSGKIIVKNSTKGGAVYISRVKTFANFGTISSNNANAVILGVVDAITNTGTISGKIGIGLFGSDIPIDTTFSNTGSIKFKGKSGAHISLDKDYNNKLNIVDYNLFIAQDANTFSSNDFGIKNKDFDNFDSLNKQSHIIISYDNANNNGVDSLKNINFKKGSIRLNVDDMIGKGFKLNTYYSTNDLILANDGSGTLTSAGDKVNNGYGLGSVDYLASMGNNIYKIAYKNSSSKQDYNDAFSINVQKQNSKSYVTNQASNMSNIRRVHFINDVISDEIAKMKEDNRFYAKAYFINDNYDLAHNNGKLDGNGYGVLFGFNKNLHDDSIIGAYVGLETQDLDNDFNHLSIKDQVSFVGLNYYKNIKKFNKSDLYIKTQARASYVDSKIDRILDAKQEDKYGSFSLGASVGLGLDYYFNDNFTIQARTNIDYDRLEHGGFTLGNENYHSNHIDLYALSQELKGIYMINDKFSINASLGAKANIKDYYYADFEIDGTNYKDKYYLDRMYYFTQLEFSYVITPKSNISLSYNGLYSDRLTSHSGVLGYRYLW